MDPVENTGNAILEDDPQSAPTMSLPESGDTGEGGKLKMIVQLVKKCLGVKDIASMRLSLPASLLEPIPNLEYWHYLDRPDLFAAINDSDDPFERMLAVLRFTLSKDLKFIHGKICKPYNSVLGEHFRCHWDVIPAIYSSSTQDPPNFPTLAHRRHSTAAPGQASTSNSDAASVKSDRSSKSAFSGFSSNSKCRKSPSTAATSLDINPDAKISKLSLVGSSEGSTSRSRVRVVYTTEQISHHPPISAYFAACPMRCLELSGIDQIVARVAATSIRVSPGNFNRGIFVNITGGPGRGEMYNITHPDAYVNGILRGKFYLMVEESSIITCTGNKDGQNFRTIIEYKEESWLGKAHFLLEGIIHTYSDGEPQYKEWTKVKHVPKSNIVAAFDGSWKNRIRWHRVAPTLSSIVASSPDDDDDELSEDYATLIDLSILRPLPKSVRPISRQLPHESRRLWEKVTSKLIKREYGDATKEKVAIEQRQRDDAAERKRKGIEYVPRYFEQDIELGIPILTAQGRKIFEEELKDPTPPCAESSEVLRLAF